MGRAALFDNPVMRICSPFSLDYFLEATLGIILILTGGFNTVHQGKKQPVKNAGNGPDAAIQVRGPDNGFKRVGDIGWTAVPAAFLLAFAQLQPIAQLNALTMPPCFRVTPRWATLYLLRAKELT